MNETTLFQRWADGADMTGEIDALKQLFTAKPRPTNWPERRERMDEICAIDPPPEGIAFTPFDIAGIPAEWSLAHGSDEGKVLIYLHGGGYCSGSITSHRAMVGRIGKVAGIRTLAVGYRRAPEHPFPAALEDALAAYRFLRSEGYEASEIAIGGDSAGGGLTLATLLSLREAGKPLPACAWLISPWVDLEMTGDSIKSKAVVDPLIQGEYLHSLAAAYLAGGDPRNPLVSPLHADLQGLPPILVQVGSDETLLDDALSITRTLGAADVTVALEIWPHMIHAWHVWSARLTDGRRATATAGAFLRAHLFGS